MRHPCEKSEYQFNIGRSYLRLGSGPPEPTRPNSHRPSSHRPNSHRPSSHPHATKPYPIRNQDLDLMFGVKDPRRTGECVAKLRYDRNTGEILSVKPVEGSSDSLRENGARRKGSSVARFEYQKEEIESTAAQAYQDPGLPLAGKLTLSSVTRHGYNVEHRRGPTVGALPGMGRYHCTSSPAGTCSHY